MLLARVLDAHRASPPPLTPVCLPERSYGDFEDFQTGEKVRGTAPAADSEGSGSEEDSGSEDSGSDSDASAEGLSLEEQRARNRAKKAKLKRAFDEQCVRACRPTCTLATRRSPLHNAVCV